MPSKIQNRLQLLRGNLAAEEPGARGFEKAARNPGCQLLQVLTVAGISPGTAGERIFRCGAADGQSPFAIGAGIQFEAAQFRNSGGRVLQLYRDANRLTMSESRIVDLSLDNIGAQKADMSRRKSETLELLKMKLAGDPNAPNLIIKPRISIKLYGIPHDLEPDALVASDSDRFYRVVEVKSYPDRAGKTCPSDLRSACRQSAVSVVALRQILEVSGVPDSGVIVPAFADLILRKPGGYWGALHTMKIKAEVHSIEAFLLATPFLLDTAEESIERLSPGSSLVEPRVLDAFPTCYRDSCREFCALADRCKQRAASEDDPATLGSRIREELASVGTITRALDFLHGRGVPPSNRAEQAIATRLKEAYSRLTEAVSHGL